MSFDIQTKDSGVIWTPPDDVKGRKVSTAWHPFWRVFLGNRVFVPVATVVKVSRRRQKLVHWTGLKHSRRKKNHINWRNITKLFISNGGTRWRSWLRHCATSGKVAGSIPSGVIGIFHWHNPSCRTVTLGLNSTSDRNEYQEYFLLYRRPQFLIYGSWCHAVGHVSCSKKNVNKTF